MLQTTETPITPANDEAVRRTKDYVEIPGGKITQRPHKHHRGQGGRENDSDNADILNTKKEKDTNNQVQQQIAEGFAEHSDKGSDNGHDVAPNGYDEPNWQILKAVNSKDFGHGPANNGHTLPTSELNKLKTLVAPDSVVVTESVDASDTMEPDDEYIDETTEPEETDDDMRKQTRDYVERHNGAITKRGDRQTKNRMPGDVASRKGIVTKQRVDNIRLKEQITEGTEEYFGTQSPVKPSTLLEHVPASPEQWQAIAPKVSQVSTANDATGETRQLPLTGQALKEAEQEASFWKKVWNFGKGWFW